MIKLNHLKTDTRNSSIEELIERGKVRRVLVIGIGGGGDVLSTIPTRNYLNSLGVETVIGGISWERITIDPKPGPRKIYEISRIMPLDETTALVYSGSGTIDGKRLQVCNFAKWLGGSVLVVDLSRGVKGTVDGLRSACKKLGIDMVIGTDGGGDVLAKGNEVGLRSPLADSIMLSSLAKLEVPTFIGVFGFGSDGELSSEELLIRLSEVAEQGGYLGARGLTPRDVGDIVSASRYVESEASYLPVLAAKGFRGEVRIREGTREVSLSIFSTITFYLDAKIVRQLSPLAAAVDNTSDLFEANERLRRIGLFTELDFELIAEKIGSSSYREILSYLEGRKE